MGYRLLLDENVEHEVGYRLENYGHDVIHVDFVSELGKGTDDIAIAEYSLDHERVIVTYDDDFVLELSEDDYFAVLFIPDRSVPSGDVADCIHEISRQYDMDRVTGLVYAGREWL